jgi:hypothetical protein
MTPQRKRLHRIWTAMRQRCSNPKCSAFKRYGNRKIQVCQEWHQFDNFVNWSLSHGYFNGATLDRRNSDKGYSPDNCRWVFPIDQHMNRRPHRSAAKRARFIGVSIHKSSGLWRARIRVKGKGNRRELGYFKSEEAAFEAYKRAFREIHGRDLSEMLIPASA